MDSTKHQPQLFALNYMVSVPILYHLKLDKTAVILTTGLIILFVKEMKQKFLSVFSLN